MKHKDSVLKRKKEMFFFAIRLDFLLMSVSLNKKHELLRQQQIVVLNSIHMIIHLIEVSHMVRVEVHIEEDETDLIEEEDLVKLWLFKKQM